MICLRFLDQCKDRRSIKYLASLDNQNISKRTSRHGKAIQLYFLKYMFLYSMKIIQTSQIRVNRLAAVACILFALNVLFFLALHDFGLARRLVHVPALAEPPAESLPHREHDRVVAILRDTMNAVKNVGSEPGSFDLDVLTRHAAAGGALMCAGMAKLFVGNLNEAGVPARRVTLVRNLGEWIDSHSTVEIAIGGRWVIYDPTFNVSFRSGGELLGVLDLYRFWASGRTGDVETVFYGEVSYPARLEDFHISYFALLNHIFFEVNESFPWYVSKVLPVRWYRGPHLRYAHIDNRVRLYEVLNAVNLFVHVVFPFIVFGLLIYCLIGILIDARKNENESK
ncbi:transglutaminase domain-containing protein [Chelatococcus daeguensis]|uniref:transglutaminase domain-containing protein n=1 Tax=Chelatococcus daeguensis TaxID=444444 RepID=UPI0009F928C8|nr:transglutaminase domain-containing protein [Chelatococcus daeguensis]